jgi:hypothetical protein
MQSEQLTDLKVKADLDIQQAFSTALRIIEIQELVIESTYELSNSSCRLGKRFRGTLIDIQKQCIEGMNKGENCVEIHKILSLIDTCNRDLNTIFE